MVFKPMKRNDVVKALTKHGCHELRDRGGHTIYGCPCGKHQTAVPRHGDISAGVVKSIGNQMTCLPKGWLQ